MNAVWIDQGRSKGGAFTGSQAGAAQEAAHPAQRRVGHANRLADDATVLPPQGQRPRFRIRRFRSAS